MASETDHQTALTTISLLEARLLRLEHLLYGPSIPSRPPTTSSLDSLANLERRFAQLLSNVRVYADLLKICTLAYPALTVPDLVCTARILILPFPDNRHPSLFHSPNPSDPPTQLSTESLRATVLACAASYPATASALTAAVKDFSPPPDPALSAALVELQPRIEKVAEMQRQQQAEMAELRARGERLVRRWYEDGLVKGASKAVADVEGRIERVERDIRRAERARGED